MSSALRFSIVGLLLITAAALGLFMFNLTRAKVQSSVEAPPVMTHSYLVAAHALPAGTLLRNEDFKSISALTIPEGAIEDTPDAHTNLRGSLIRNFVETSAPLTATDMLRPRDRGFIASVLKEGTRAVAIGVDPISGVAGLIWPGDHVDIILTQDIEKAALAQRTLSETILTDVRIIAIDQEMVQGAATAAGKLVRTVTVEVEPGQAEQIAVASHIGKLTLSIRAAMDASMAARRVTYGGDVSPALAHAEGERRATVTVFEGKERKDVSFP